jgi:hypothetical protein
MASNAKKRTTMAKIARENALRERRLRKQARKQARKQEAAEQSASPSGDLVAGAAVTPED